MSSELLRKIEQKYLTEKKYPDFRVGYTIRIHYKIKEGDKERIQPFEGVVIRIRGSGAGKTFTVRRESFGVGIERTFPYYSPNIEKIEVVKIGKVRRAKLYYLRELRGKEAERKIKEIKPWEYEAMQRRKEEARRQREKQIKSETQVQEENQADKEQNA